MSQALVWLIAEIIKLTVERVSEMDKFNSLNEEEAKAIIAKIAGGLSEKLPTPEELENLGG